MVAFKNLMVRVTGNLVFLVDKSLVQRQNYRIVLFTDILRISLIQSFENIMKSFGLGVIGTKQIIFVAVKMVLIQIIQQQIKLFVE